MFKRKKREHMEHQLRELERFSTQRETRNFYRGVNQSRKEFKPRLSMVRNREGEIICEQAEVLETWAESFEERLNMGSERADGDDCCFDRVEDDREKYNLPSEEEVLRAIGKLKNHKAPGIDGIPSELVKHGINKLKDHIWRLVKLIWKNLKLPKEWNIGIIVPIHKKGDHTICDNYRGITLLSVTYKVLAYILYDRLSIYCEGIIGGYQSGFRKGKSTVDQIFLLRQALEKTYEYGMDTHHLFIDFKCAYDSIDRRSLYTTMREFDIPVHLIKLIKTTLSHVECKVKVQNSFSRSFQTRTGLRQGDSLSCLLFNIALEKAVRESEIANRGNIINRSVQILAYADDIDIMARTKRDLIEAFKALETAAKRQGLQVNTAKTKYMRVTNNAQQTPSEDLIIGPYTFGGVREFIYLGAQVNARNLVSAEIRRRIYMANRAYFGLGKLLTSGVITKKSKLLVYKTLIKPVLTYASETWTMTKSDEDLLGCFERKILRHIYRGVQENGVWRRRCNFELYRLYEEPNIVRSIKVNRLRWLGHVERMDDMEPSKRMFHQAVVGTRKRGRPRSRFKDQVEDNLKTLGVRNWKARARDGRGWKLILEQARTHQGL